MAGYNPVSGGGLYTLTGGRAGEEPTYGLQEAYDKRINTIENTLATKYPDGDYSDTQLDERLAELKDLKAREKDVLDAAITGAPQENIGATDSIYSAPDTLVGPNIDEEAGRFSDEADIISRPITTDITSDQIDEFGTAPGTLDQIAAANNINITGGFPTYESLPEGAETDFFSGPAYDKYSKARADAYANAPSKLEYDLAANKAAGQFLQDKAKEKLGDNILGKTVGTLGAVAGVPAAIFASPFHEALQAKERVEAAFKGASPTIMAQGPTVGDYVSGFLDEQPLRTAINRGAGVLQSVPVVGDAITGIGEGIYDLINDPTIAEGTLADDTINRMTDDVDLDLFNTTPQDIPTSTFDADTFDDDVSFDADIFDDFDDGTMTGSAADSMDDVLGPMPGIPTPRVPDFISGGREDKPTGPPSTGFKAPTKQGQSPRGSTTGGGGGRDSCFLPDTLVTMADGSTKKIIDVDIGDEVAEGGKVFATGKFLNNELYDYKGIKVSGSHMVNEDGVWMRIRDTKHGKPLGDDEHTVYVFGSENRRILINNILFTDYFEIKEQEKLIDNEKDFFNNWKTYGNKIDQDNINILNAS